MGKRIYCRNQINNKNMNDIKFYSYIRKKNIRQNLILVNIFDLMNKFKNDKVRYKELIENNESQATNFFVRTINKIYELEPIKVFFSITKSNSIYFRIYQNHNTVIHFEVFYTKEDENDAN